MGTVLSSPQSFASIEQRLGEGAESHRIERPHQPQLDGVRGLAILAVLASHAATVIGAPARDVPGAQIWLDLMTPGWGGVDLFFVLSGFLITGILLRTRLDQHYFKSFYARRALRIFPIYYLVLIVSLLVCTQVPALQQIIRGGHQARLPGTFAAKISFFLYLQNVPMFWASLSGGLTGLWGAYWSLALEEQFYLVWPSVVRFVRSSVIYWVCLLAVCAGPVLRAVTTHFTTDSLGLLQFPFSRLDGLFAGAALAIYRERKGKPLPLRWSLTLGLAGCALLGYIAVAHEAELTGPKWWMNRFGVTGFVLCATGMVALTQLELPIVARVLTLRPLRFFGKYSYGIYIFHPAVFLLAGGMATKLLPTAVSAWSIPVALLYDVAAVALAVVIAMGSYRFVERPFLNLKDRFPSTGTTRQPQRGWSRTTWTATVRNGSQVRNVTAGREVAPPQSAALSERVY